MALIGKFIGVNTYIDRDIKNLAGAGRDALALWALFSDTLPAMQAELLTAANADLNNIKRALKETLESATEDDEIILFYSGHGSPDHRLAAHDTLLTDLINTTVSMQELADLFRQSKAKSILCILDCCFSGGANAKVLDSAPIAKSMGNPLKALAGKGKVIIAASNFDEPSYELGTTGHGILTKAILDTLQSPEDKINLLIAMNSIMEIVRTEASRIGVVQTPVLLNNIEGGLILPSLKAGEKYFAAFPNTKEIKITKNIDDLSKFGFPNNLLNEWKVQFSQGLNDLQMSAINEYRILDGDSLLAIAPTSSGKTVIGELASIRTILDGRKAVFLLPYRALVNEKYDQFYELYEKKLGYKVIRCTGDYQDQNDDFIKGKYDIAFLTYEMFLNLSVSIPSVLNTTGLIVLDEAQFITDPKRGITVELLLTHVIIARARGISPQLIVLSAVIGNSNYFEDWLGCKKLVHTQRPVPLIEGVMDRTGRFKFIDVDGSIKETQLLDAGAIYVRKDKPQAQDMIVPLVKKLVDKGEKIIVFRNRRGNAKGCALYLSLELGLESAIEEIRGLPKNTSSSTSQNLKNSLNGGVGFHNSNLSREERTVVERTFRNPNSKVKVLAATTTLAAGLNTPASTVILAEQQFVGEDGRPFTIAEYKNMAGRAGRVGFNEQGKSIILADEGSNIETLFSKYVLGALDNLNSSFKMEELDTWIIRLLAQLKDIPKSELLTLLVNTYGGYVKSRNSPDWYKETELRMKDLYDQMNNLGLVEEENGFVHLTLLGRACGESVLSFKSALRLVELLKSYPQGTLTAEGFMAVVQALPESDESYTPMFKKGTSEAVRPRDAASRYGSEIIRLLQRFVPYGEDLKYYARCKRAAVLYDWVHGVPTETIEANFKSKNPYLGNIEYGDIRSIADLTRFQIRSAFKIATLIFPGQMLDEQEIDKLLKRLEVGIPESALFLLELPLSMTREEYLAIINMGILNKESLFATVSERLETALESSTVKKINSLKTSR